MLRQGWVIGRDQTGPIMRDLGLGGVVQSKKVFTTRTDPAGSRPADLVERCFVADAPKRLRVAEITYVRTWSGFAYLAFVTEVLSQRIVSFNVASTLKADILPLQALEIAAFAASGDLTGLRHHSDHGSNYMAMVYTNQILKLSAKPSTSSISDSYDNALTEAINGRYKAELIRHREPWRKVKQLKLATLERVRW